MENLEIYNKVRVVPKSAQKEIKAGRLKGMTDINPQWRIEKLTEVFGPCGIGWYAEELKREFVNGANNEVMCFVDIALYVNYKRPFNSDTDMWSKPIYGTGGSSFVAKESKGLYTSDEVVKMAYTDAISVACKQLGFGADVYWSKSESKYTKPMNHTTESTGLITDDQKKYINTLLSKAKDRELAKKELYEKFKITTIKDVPKKTAKDMIDYLVEKNKNEDNK